MENFAVTEVLAKINLTLEAKPKRSSDSGLHRLKSVVVPFHALKDRVTVAARDDDRISVVYSDGRRYADDKAFVAAETLKRLYGTMGADILVEKGIPEGVGIGSSSAPIAGIVKCFKELYGISPENEVLVKLGSDVPVQVYGGAAMVGAYGGEVTPLELPPLYITLVYGDSRVNTGDVFALYDVIGGTGGESELFAETLTPFNALETAAIALDRNIVSGRKALYEAGFDRVVMTGSGSGYVGIALEVGENAELFDRARAIAAKHNLEIFNSVIHN